MGIENYAPTRLAIIGAGTIAREHLRAFCDLDDIEIVGICAPTERHSRELANEFEIKVVCKNIPALWEETRADAVIVAVPILKTYEVCTEVFSQNWVSLIEKPAGYNLSQAEELSSLAATKAHKCFVALNRRHFGSTSQLRKLFDANQSNRVIHINDQEDTLQGASDGFPKTVIENWHFANSIHLIDYFLQFGRGNISRVTRNIEYRESQLSHVSAEIEFSSGDNGLYEAVWNSPAPWSVRIEADSVIGELKPIEQARVIRTGEPPKDFPTDHLDIEFKPGFRRQAELFIEHIRGQIVNSELPTLNDALATMRLIDLIYGSPEATERTINIQ